MAIQILAKGAAYVGKRHIVDRRAGHARLDPLEIGEIVESRLEDTVRRHCLVETGLRRKRRHTTPGNSGHDTGDQLARQGG